jgi:hypothetical protein
VYRLTLACFLTTSACATTRLTLAETEACETFAEVDAAVRAELERLLAEAPGDVLVKEASRLNLARRACAKHRLAELRDLREREGVNAVQSELDALSRTYAPAELQALIVDALGPEADQLTPLLAEARQRTARESSTGSLDRRDDAALKTLAVDGPSRIGPEPTLPDTLCDAPTPCEQLQCVAREGGSVDAPARACLDTLNANTPESARRVATVLALLPPGVSGARTEATMRLEVLRQTVWPQVDAARTAGHRARAATLATPFAALPSFAAQVAALREAARQFHLERAKAFAAWPDASWLHARIAETFGAASATTARPLEGKWQSVRWRCVDEQPALPALPSGVSAVLTVRCERPKAESTEAQPRSDFMQTFDYEKQLKAQRVLGSLNLTCAERSTLYTVNAEDGASVPLELARLLEVARSDCVKHHALAAVKDCAELRRRSPGELTARFVDHARATQKWEPCFVEWLAAEEGAAPPALPDK